MPTVKVAVFSDIHSNYHALRACYEDALAQEIDRFIFLGDYVSDLAEPEKTLDLVYEICEKYPTVCLLGNRERYLLECRDGRSFFAPGSKSGSLLFTYTHLRPKDFLFFDRLKKSATVSINGYSFEIAHAAMDDDRCYFEGDDAKTKDIFQSMSCSYLLTGHSHKQYIARHNGKTILNPGSVGLPQGGNNCPKYAVVHIGENGVSCRLRQVRCDLADVIHSQFSTGLVDMARYWAIGILYDLITGENYVLKLLKYAESSGDVSDEAVWRAAAAAFHINCSEAEILAFYRNRPSIIS